MAGIVWGSTCPTSGYTIGMTNTTTPTTGFGFPNAPAIWGRAASTPDKFYCLPQESALNARCRSHEWDDLPNATYNQVTCDFFKCSSKLPPGAIPKSLAI
ncbi:hypothetical protein EVAR_103917_1 [Eumeta japonica]|uniref:Uncharacterized protein n=1 Tax=Eumeta variegata TaxID=151549 RepID=A0A4C1STG1_EUMVA|nr:hypothetical protein EVAR_103917_1 [Eumeta japonica]